MWLNTALSIALVCCVLPATLGAPTLDLITQLPGLSKLPPFKQYSGYLKGDSKDDKYLHYWFIESSSNPSTDPVVLWMNGGPGCSSDLGLLTEHGPFRVSNNGTLTYNPFSWNQSYLSALQRQQEFFPIRKMYHIQRAANMIYLESPVGVGFSYAHSGNYKTNDSVVAMQNAFAINDFFTKFPEYKGNDFYITGESYGGIYVPTLTSEILDHYPHINLKGFAVGNGMSSYNDNDNSIVYFAYYHGLISDQRWEFLMENCCPEYGPKRCNFTKAAEMSTDCRQQMNEVSTLTWASGLDVYNLYSECAGGVNTGFSTVYRQEDAVFESSYFGWPFSYLDTPRLEMAKRQFLPKDKLRVGPPCSDFSAVVNYLNSPKVKEALHISPFAMKWEPCSGIVTVGYTTIYRTMHAFYEKALEHKMRMLIYNGDVDMACNFMMEEWFVDRLPLKNPSDRKMWYYKAEDSTKQVAGFVQTYDQLTLVTVKGAGHMVPTDKPRPALEMFVNFVQDKPFMH